MKTGLGDLSQPELHSRIRASLRLPDLPKSILELEGWERVISFTHPRHSDIWHEDIILRDVASAKNNRFLPLHTLELSPEQMAYKEATNYDWVLYPNHPFPEVREEVREAAHILCLCVLKLQDRGLVEVTFVTEN